jgi:hypothetical protein
MSVEKCENCAFGIKVWLHHGYRMDCRRHAPIVFEGVVGSKATTIGTGPEYTVTEIRGPVTAWPQVEADHFCGDWELQDAS